MADLAAVATYVPVFPVGPQVYSGSAVVCADGRVLYAYVPGSNGWDNSGGGVRGVYYADMSDFAFAASTVTDAFGTYRRSIPIEGSDHAITIPGLAPESVSQASCSLWWGFGVLYLTVIYIETIDGTWSDPDLPRTRRAEMWTSPSGNGGDWQRVAELAEPTIWNGARFLLPGAGTRRAGVGTETPAGLAVPLTLWIEEDGLSRTRPTIVLGSGGSWEVVHEQGYLFGGGYGSEIARRVVPHAGLYWSSNSGNDPGMSDRAAVSGDGASWTAYADLPATHDRDRPYLISEGGRLHRAAPAGGSRYRIEATDDPRVGPWEPITGPLNGGEITDGSEIGYSGALLWMEMSPGYWALFSHDKVWFVFGGWVLGAIGRS